ncbi:MAG: GIY-YIG nuclease family protein [Betaproteobacteria bacterium]|nr:GIY-YIG nuclease family protein [Betaproteobacteria bacterium]
MMKPFSLRIFVADGDPDGLRLVERSNWVGKAVMFPRALLPKVKLRDELSQTGVYLLLGPRESGEGEALYIGEGDPVRPRLESHYAQKDFWNRAVCFVAAPGQLNKAHVQFLESQLIQLAKAAKRLPLDNANHPAEPSLSEADRADMQVFLENMLGMLTVLGIHAFEQAAALPSAAVNVFTCKWKVVVATGFEATQGFVVKAGSQAVGTSVPSMQQHVRSMFDLRQELIQNGVLQTDGERYRFAQDYVFSSPSTAAAVVLGRSANGRIEWKDTTGRALKEIQAAGL